MKYTLWITGIMLMLGIVSCEENKYSFYEQAKDAVYFSLADEDRDSMVFSLAKYLSEQVEIKIPLELAGYPSATERKYKVSVVRDSTTAEEGKHYQDFNGEHIFRANSSFDTLVVVLKTTDPELLTSYRRLYFELEPTEDLGSGINYKQQVDLRFTNGLSKPLIWDTYYQFWFGSYSRVKYIHCLLQLGLEVMPDEKDGDLTRWDAYGLLMNQYFTDHIVLDEDNMQILPWR